MVICLERDADLHMAQLMSLPLTVSCFSKIQIGLTFLVPAHPGSPGKRAVKWVCVCVCEGQILYLCLYSPKYGVRALSLHEGEPGHHFQVSGFFAFVIINICLPSVL